MQVLGDHFLEPDYKVRSRMGGDRFASQDAVGQLDLSRLVKKLCLPVKKGGKGWSRKRAENAQVWYKRFLMLRVMYPGISLVPTYDIDQMWHTHILDTSRYHVDCQAIFGKYLHHFPSDGDDDRDVMEDSFNKTKEFFIKHFGESPEDSKASGCFNNCRPCGLCKSQNN